MRKVDKEIKDFTEIEEVIRKADICRLGLIDGDEPYIVPMNFGYKDNSLYFHSATEGRKLDILKKNNKVCFELETDVATVKGDTLCKWSMKYRSVIGTGKAYLLEGKAEKTRGLKVITDHYSKQPFVIQENILDKTAIIRVDIEAISGKKSRI